MDHTEYQKLTAGQTHQYIENLRRLFPSVRLLDAATVRARAMKQHEGEHADPSEHTEECIAYRALQEKTTLTKADVSGSEAVFFTAEYLEVDGAPSVIEMSRQTDADYVSDIDTGSTVYRKEAGRYEKLYSDVLTGAYNRRYYEEYIRNEKMVGGVAMVDIDDFKLYNDIYGHPAGDSVLSAVAAAMRSEMRHADKLIRYGGDEFLLVMPDITEKAMEEELHRIGHRVGASRFMEYDGLRLTVSIGGVLCRDEIVQDSVHRADELMYRAKLKKNSVVTECSELIPADNESKPTVLIADDAEINRAILTGILEKDFHVVTASNGDECIDILKRLNTSVAVVLLDIVMPGTDGFGVLEYMSVNRLLDGIPVITITSDSTNDSVRRAYEMGVTDYISPPYDAQIVLRRVENAVRLYAKQRRLLTMVTTQMIAQDRNTRFLVGLIAKTETFRNTMDNDDPFRIGRISRAIIDHLAERDEARYTFDNRDVNLVCNAALVHDIGMVGVKRTILKKPGKLTPEEYEEVKQHTVFGASLVESMATGFRDEPLYRWVYQVCRWHHERYDGKGYPDGLSGSEIPIAAQIVGIADVYDALTSNRVYRPAFSPEDAMRMIRDGECGAFDPVLVEALTDAQPELTAPANESVPPQK